MGVLDDAIREHLDLKRRRGADPAEVERAEQEALGPVRREPEDVAAQEAELDEPELALEDDLPYVDGETEFSETWEPAPERLDHSAPPEPDPLAGGPPPGPAVDQQAPDEEPIPDPRRSEPFDHGHETAEYDVEEALEQEHGKEGDDVLEETPDFLQDTPDHDRLWFEQKPPRDFKFDG